MLNKPWLAHYPPGVAAEVRTDAYDSLADLLDESFRRYALRDAATCMDSRLRYHDVHEMSSALGAFLQGKGPGRGARVAIMMPNVLQYVVTIAAILRAGFVVVNVNPLYTPRELEHQLKDSGAKAIVVLENFAGTLEEASNARRYARSSLQRWAIFLDSGRAMQSTLLFGT